MRPTHLTTLASLLTLTLLAGCHITSHKNGENDNVDIGTPFGSMHVKTNDNVAPSDIGIASYPGAQMAKKNDHDNGAADINMSFGSFHLGVKAASFLTPDSQDKVLAFYKKDLARYGEVLQCEGKRTVGEPTRTSEGLTCDYDTHKSSGHIQWNSDSSKNIELRTGSKQRQHVVSIEPDGANTKIGLIALELPSGLDHGDHHDSD
jgi:hypothetical protein